MSTNQHIIDCVIIPARGGSKRIPQKNLLPFLGIPMLERSILLAKSVSANVIVSSDDEKILKFASEFEVIALPREAHLASDMSPTLPVLHHIVTQLLGSSSDSSLALPLLHAHSTVLCLYPTAMFTERDSIAKACRLLLDNPSSAYIVAIFSNQKALRSFTLDNEKNIQFLFPQFLTTRSQDLPLTYNDAGQFYLGFAKSYADNIPLLGNKSKGLELEIAHDIDTYQDLAIAQCLKQIIEGK
ncbi:pseudaminic acid cytidylyltransferase [Helicobacter aurati]|uniref:Pseudaminic acid cytidylyltransferase n=1 Tax=Helicobacter aurati TaxID=137778 RepID=A0A3D8J7Q8_9HELI|nr:pseudaminic acid cytidylyltransferase [Helicobacter aurati]RDU73468.1 pseudaminic acid cytidylyltransferase [Helicobacter aurati]